MGETDVIVDLPIVGGQDEHSDRRLAVRPLSLVNCRYRYTGSLSKRFGSVCLTPNDGTQNAAYTPSVKPGDIRPPVGLFGTEKELLRFGRGMLDAVESPAVSAATSTTQSLTWRDTISSTHVVREKCSTDVIGDFNVASDDVFLYCVYTRVYRVGATTGLSIELEVRDRQTLAVVYKATALDGFPDPGYTKPRVVAVRNATGERCCIVLATVVVAVGSDTDLVAVQFNAATGGLGSTVTLFGDTRISAGYDADSDGTNLYVLYEDYFAVTNRFKLAKWTGDLMSVSSTSMGGSDSSARTLSVVVAGNVVYAAYLVLTGGVTNDVRGYGFTTSLGSVFGPVSIYSHAYAGSVYGLAGCNVGGSCTYLISVKESGAAWDAVYINTVGSTGGVGTVGASPLFGHGLWSKPWAETSGSGFTFRARVYAYTTLLDSYGGTQKSFFLARWEVSTPAMSPIIDATVAPLQVFDSVLKTTGRTASQPVSVAAVTVEDRAAVGGTATAYVAGLPIDAPIDPSSSNATRGFNVDLAVSTPASSYCVVNGAAGVAMSGGVPAVYDGIRTSEFSFGYVPRAPTLADAAGGSMTLLGTYSYCEVLAYYDAAGNVTYGPVSPVTIVQLTGTNQSVDVTVDGVVWTNRYDNQPSTPRSIRSQVYRTEANGTVFYLLQELPQGGAFNDTLQDSDLRTRQTLYTTGNRLESFSPPSSRFAVYALGRLFLLGTDSDAIYPSGLLTGGEFPSFSLATEIEPFAGGRVTGAEELDTSLVIFKESSIWALDGVGPDDTGAGSFSPIRAIASDVGCIDARSIVRTPSGILFMSKDGICLLDRGGSVRRIGKPVEDTAGLSSPEMPRSVVRGVNVPSLTEVRFALQYDTPGSQSCQAVVLDLGGDGVQPPAWYRYTWSSQGISGGMRMVGATLYQGLFTWITDQGYVFQETYTSNVDAFVTGSTASWVTMTVDLAPFRMSGIQNYGRVRRAAVLADRRTAHDLVMQIYSDYAESAPQTVTWSNATLSGLDREQTFAVVTNQKTQSMRVVLSDASPSSGSVGTGQGCVLTGISLRIAPKTGLRRRPPAAG